MQTRKLSNYEHRSILPIQAHYKKAKTSSRRSASGLMYENLLQALSLRLRKLIRLQGGWCSRIIAPGRPLYWDFWVRPQSPFSLSPSFPRIFHTTTLLVYRKCRMLICWEESKTWRHCKARYALLCSPFTRSFLHLFAWAGATDIHLASR